VPRNFIAALPLPQPHCFVKDAGNGQVVLCGAGEAILGVAGQETVTVGGGVRVYEQADGLVPVLCGGTVKKHAPVKSDASGQAVAGTISDHLGGLTMETGASGKRVMMRLFPRLSTDA
jgi:hypothetical protein